jgi:hypothetical protein
MTKAKKDLPVRLKEVLEKAPLAWGIIALSDYREGKKTVSEIVKEWEEYKSR